MGEYVFLIYQTDTIALRNLRLYGIKEKANGFDLVPNNWIEKQMSD